MDSHVLHAVVSPLRFNYPFFNKRPRVSNPLADREFVDVR